MTRLKIAGRIDNSVVKPIEAQQHKRGVTLSAMLDTIAWHYFGKPKLSFEQEGDQ